jgi:hypothetical protein
MKRIITAIFFVLIAFTLYSQNRDTYNDLIVLKNGSKLYGSIIDYRVGGQVQIKLENGSILTFNDDVVTKIEIAGKNTKAEREYQFSTSTIYHNFGIKIIPGNDVISDEPRYGTGLEYNIGYRFSNLALLGGGIAAEYFNYGFNEFFFPVYMDFTSFFRKSPVSPFFRLQGGYSMLYTNSDNVIDKTGGIMINPALGIKFQGNYGINYTLDVNFKYQQAKFTYLGTWGNQVFNREVNFQRLLLRFGMLF